MHTLKTLRVLAPLGLVAAPAAATAAPLDYVSLQEMFGEPVTASATGAPQRATEAPVNMTIISAEEIARSGANSIPGVLQKLSSLDVVGYSRGQEEVSVRGYVQPLNSRLLVLVNGRQVYIDHYGMTNWDLIPVELGEIRQIEVVRGPNTALFGFNAVAGVINIITVDALIDDVDFVQARVGEPTYASGSASVSYRLTPTLGVQVSVGGYEADRFEGDPARIDPARESARGALAWNVTPTTRVDLEATWSTSDRFEYSSGVPATFEQHSLKAALQTDTPLGLLQTQAYSNWVRPDYKIATGASAVYDNQVTVASAALIAKPATAHTLRLSGEYRKNVLEQTPFQGKLQYEVAALATMWNWAITDRVASTIAVRADQLTMKRTGAKETPLYPFENAAYDRDFTEWSANAGVVWRASDADSIRFSAARGLQSPSLIEYGWQFSVPSARPPFIVIGGDPSIDPTVVENVELGWDRKLDFIGAQARASVFWQRNSDLKFLTNRMQPLSQTTIGIFASNGGDSEATGFELGLKGHVNAWSWYGEYAYRTISDSFTGSLRPIPYERTSPEHTATAGLDWIGQSFEFGAQLRAVSESVGLTAGISSVSGTVTEIDPYAILNARAAWKVTDGLVLELSGRNLASDDVRTTERAPSERSFFLTATKSF